VKYLFLFLPILLVLHIPLLGYGQTKASGPIIKDFGKVYKIEHADIELDTTKTYKVVFDIMDTPEGHETRNAKIETAARFLNMHAQNGVPKEQLKVKVIVHNKASKDLSNNDSYKKKYGFENPNQELIKALLAADVEFIFCGQSSVSRGFPKSDLIPGVQLSLSAMTALIAAQEAGYQLIKF